MKLLKDYKGAILIYLVITIINVVWIINYDKPSANEQVSNSKTIVMAEKINN